MTEPVTIVHNPVGICCKKIEITIEDNIVKDALFTGGCPGNHEAIRRLIKGKPVAEVVEILLGTPCGSRTTSCADQLAMALKDSLCAHN